MRPKPKPLNDPESRLKGLLKMSHDRRRDRDHFGVMVSDQDYDNDQDNDFQDLVRN